MLEALNKALNQLSAIESVPGVFAQNVQAVVNYRGPKGKCGAQAFARASFKAVVFSCVEEKPDDMPVKVRWTDVRPDAVVPLNDHE